MKVVYLAFITDTDQNVSDLMSNWLSSLSDADTKRFPMIRGLINSSPITEAEVLELYNEALDEATKKNRKLPLVSKLDDLSEKGREL